MLACYRDHSMATPAQIAANRLNAQKSTGPRSVEGKAASSCNALKHGLDAASTVIPGEDPAALIALAAEYHSHFAPQGPVETGLVEILIQSDWQQRRYRRIEAAVLNHFMTAQAVFPQTLGAAWAEAPAGHPIHRIARRLETATRTWFRAHKELRTLQAERRAQDADAEPESESATASEPAPKPANWVRSEKPAQAPSPQPAGGSEPRSRPAYFIG